MRLFILLGSLLVLALIAALVVPLYVDWNQFKDRFERETSKVLGQPVQVRGETNLRLLPLPTITFNNLLIGSEDAPMLEAQSFRMDIELAPLLKGEVVIVDMQMDQPQFDLKVDKSGKLHWPETNDQFMRDFGLNEISMDRITINNGEIRLIDARYQRKVVLTDVNIDAAAKTLSGPWRSSGHVSYDGVRYQFSGSTGLWHEPGEMRVKLKVHPQNQPYDYEIDGPLKIAELIPSFIGKLMVRPKLLAAEDDGDFPRPARDTALPIRLEADLELAAGGATLPAFELSIGSGVDPYKMAGTGQALFSEEVSFQFRVEGQQIDVERLSGENSEKTDTAEVKPISLSQRSDAVLAILEKIPQFKANGEVNLYLPAVITGDTVIRDIGVDLRPSADGTGWQMRNLEAQFPGRTDVRADGVLVLGDEFAYEGELLVASRQPSGLAVWLGSEATAAIREMPSAGFSAHARINKTDAVFSDLEIGLGNRVLKGKIHRKSSANARPQLFANLSGSGVNLDQITALAGIFVEERDETGVTLLGAHDLDLELNADTLIAAGVTANSVAARLSYIKNTLDLKSLEISSLAGAEVSLSGSVSDITGAPVGELTGKYSAENSSGFLTLLQKRGLDWPILKRLVDDPQSITATKLDGSLEFTPTGYYLKSMGVSGGSNVDFELSGTALTKSFEKQKINGRLIMDNAQASNLLLQLGIPVVPLDVGGRAAFRAVVNGSAETGLNVEGALTMGEGYISGIGKLATRKSDGSELFNGNIDLTLEAQNLDPFIILSGLPLPGMGEGLAARLSGRLGVVGETYRLENFKSKIGEVDVTGSLEVDGDASPRVKASGELNVSTLDVQTLAGLVYTGQPESTGETQEGEAVIVNPVLSGLDARITLNTDVAELPNGLGQVAKASSELIIHDGDVNISSISGALAGGKIIGELNFAQSNGTRLLNGELQLQGADLASLFKIAGFEPIVTGKVDGSGTFESTGKDGASMLSKLTGSGTLSLPSGVLNGLDDQAFAKILKAADRTDDKKLSDETSNLLNKNAYSGSMSYDPTDLVYNVSSGVVRAANVRLKNNNMSVVGVGRFDLNSGAVSVDARVAYEAGRQFVAGASPEYSIEFEGKAGNLKRLQDDGLFATYLGLRLSEKRQRAYEAQQSEILERQRLQQTVRLYALKADAERIATEEEARVNKLKEEEAARVRKFEEENALRQKIQEVEEAEQRRREKVLIEMEEVQRQRLKEQLIEAEEKAKREAERDAGQREQEQKKIDELRKKAEEALKRVRNGQIVEPVE